MLKVWHLADTNHSFIADTQALNFVSYAIKDKVKSYNLWAQCIFLPELLYDKISQTHRPVQLSHANTKGMFTITTELVMPMSTH